MAFFRQTWTLVEKTLTIVFLRHILATIIRAFLAPIIFVGFLAYAKNLFVPPSDFGNQAEATPLRTFSEALAASAGGRNTVVFVNNGFTNGDIAEVIETLSQPVRAQGFTALTVTSEIDLLTTCRSSLRGVSTCFAAASFYSSPTQGEDGYWNYTIRADGAFGTQIYVHSTDNDAQIYVLPLQHEIDSVIAAREGASLPANVQQYPYTSQTNEERNRNIIRLYMGTLINILGLAYFIGIVGVCYQLTGEMAKERELGMSQLIEAMMPNRRRWAPQAARLLSIHIAFDILYVPSWIVMGATVGALNYTQSSVGIPIGYFIMAGLALSSWSIAFASIFRKAQLSGITVTIVSIVLAIIIQVTGPLSTGAAYLLTLIFPPMNFTYFIIYMAYWQRQNLPALLSQAAPEAPWRMPGYVFFIFALIQIIAYPIIGAYIERALYGTASKARTLHYSPDSSTQAIRITQLSKHYSPAISSRFFAAIRRKGAPPPVRAVDEIDMNVGRGQIMVLLGANGSGKSTTLDMLAGLQKPTSGSIEMDAYGGIGLCPQKNILWAELSVYEHVRIFNRLKSDVRDSKEQIKQLIKDCDLEQKINAQSQTLSGGQKRKCQLAMMFTGGSTVCMLDEVSSGVDPLSRRKLWDIILAERGKRSMILTTHALDEGDLLSDDITILSRGRRVAHGSAVELKHRLGGGYRVHVYHEDQQDLPEKLAAVHKRVLHDQTVYSLADSTTAASFIAELEAAGVRDYQVNGPSIEDVFLKLADEVKEELDKDVSASLPGSGSREGSPTPKGLQLVAGKRISFARQTWVLMRKRATIFWRNPWPYMAALLIPIVAAGLVTLFLKGFSRLSCTPGADTDQGIATNLANSYSNDADIPAGPANRLSSGTLFDVFPIIRSALHDISSLTELGEYVSANYSSVIPGGFFLGDQPTFAWRGNYEMSFAIATQNLMDISLSNTPIVTSFNPFAVPWSPNTGNSLQFILYFGLAMCAYPGFFALYPNAERLRNVRALHYSNGISAGPLWVAYIASDFLIVLLVSAVAVIIFTAASSIWYAPGYLFVVFILYGLSATLLSYIVSLFTTSQLAAFAFAAGGQCCFFLIYFITYMCIITYIPAASIDNDIRIATYTIGIFFPGANLLRALFLVFNEFSALCKGNSYPGYPGEWSVYGSCIAYLALQSIVFVAVLVAWDSGWKPRIFMRSRQRPHEIEESEEVDADVFAEAHRVDESQDELRVMHVSKTFGENKAVQNVSFGVPKGEMFALLGPNGAGKSTTITMIRGDIRPSERSSEVLIEGTSVVRRRAAARIHLGVCPQFDAMDQMTAIEHLRFYARARGVPDVEHNVDQVIHAVGIHPFKDRMAAKLSGGNKRKLSLGIALMGNPSVVLLDEPSSGMDAASKRVMWRTLKAIAPGRALCLTTHAMEEANALADRAGIMAKRMLAIGTADQLRKKHGDAYHVHLVHRDAPHTDDADMDAIRTYIARAFPRAVVEDRSFHGQLRFSVPNDRTVVTYSDEAIDCEKAHDEVSKKAAATVVSTTSSSSRSISTLFQQLEANKEVLGFQYYSVSQATLDQVFLSIVTKHNIQEENYVREHGPTRASVWRRVKQFMSQNLF